jgi:hypothetical protein
MSIKSYQSMAVVWNAHMDKNQTLCALPVKNVVLIKSTMKKLVTHAQWEQCQTQMVMYVLQNVRPTKSLIHMVLVRHVMLELFQI